MDNREFINLIITASREFSVEWALGNNSGVSIKAQQWLNELTEEEKLYIQESITEAVDNALINLLEVMDGVHDKNKLPIEAASGSHKISGEGCEQLHDIYSSKI